jgi:hypothetical protein
MTELIQQHLRSITASNLEDFQHDAFISMASSTGVNGHCMLGVNATGFFVVKTDKETYIFKSASAAIERYKDCLLN